MGRRRILVVTHAPAKAKGSKERDPELTAKARDQAERVGRLFWRKDYEFRNVAVSPRARTLQTAEQFNAVSFEQYPELDEVNTNLPRWMQWICLRTGRIPDEFMKAGRELLDNPPPEDKWFTHRGTMGGLLFAARERPDVIAIPLWEADGMHIPDIARMSPELETRSLYFQSLGAMLLELPVHNAQPR